MSFDSKVPIGENDDEMVKDFNQTRERSESKFEDDFVDVDDFKQYANTTVKDLPKPEKRDTVKTHKYTKTELNNKDVLCTITNFEVRKQGLFRKYVQFAISTEIPGQLMKSHVQRTDDDFATLRRLLGIYLPYMIIPPLPPQKLVL